MENSFRDRVWDRNGLIEQIIGGTDLPEMVKVSQNLFSDTLENIPSEIKDQLWQKKFTDTIRPGMTVAVTAGSRGIDNIALIIKETVSLLKSLGARPFIFPAMGSHGGASAEGQQLLLESLGITEKYIGAPVKSSMEVVQIAALDDGRPVFLDKFASEADGIVVINRVKAHTSFRGTYESGILKMLAVGAANQKGAEACHCQGPGKMADNVKDYGLSILHNSSVLFGIAIIENAYDRTSRIICLTKEEIPVQEPLLLNEAKKKMAKIFFENIDIMIVDEIGKNYSGTGMDPNITGSYATQDLSGPPYVDQYVVLGLSEESHGNCMGLGLAHYTTRKVFEQSDLDATYMNALTAGSSIKARIPMVLNTERLAIQAAVYMRGGSGTEKPGIVRIKNSAHVDEIWISEPMLEEAENNLNIQILGEAEAFDFTEDGSLKREE